MTSIYKGQFYRNVLVVERTGCGKTTYLEKLGLNNFFGDIIKTEWISGIDIDKTRETEIQSYFSNETEVHVGEKQDELDPLTATFKLQSREDTINNNNVNNSFGEIKKLDRPTIMDDVSGVADVSKKFVNFLTVSRTFGYNCVYVFHVIIPTSQIWQKIISQRNILNIFPASVPHNTLQKLFKIIAFYKVRSMFLYVLFGLIEFLLIWQIVTRSFV